MKKYVAFLRAVNVGGHKSVRMEDLKRLFESLGCVNVETFIQSGNVIFEYEEKVTAALERQIESALEKSLGYEVDIFLRTIQEVSAIAAQKLYQPQEGETLHIIFLNKVPAKKARQALMDFNREADDFKFKGREVYNLRRNREKSVFSNNFVEKVLNTPATTRNWNTIGKLAEKYAQP